MEFLEGLGPLPGLAGRLQLAVLSTDVFLQQFHKHALSLTWKSCILSIMKTPYQPNFLLFALLPTTEPLVM